MIKQLLEEVRAAPLDEASRSRLREIHATSIRELEEGLAPELRDELDRLTLPFTEGTVPSDAELRIAQAQLVGWLEGLFHGIQTALFAQQMAARAQLEQMREQRGLPPGAGRPGGSGSWHRAIPLGRRPGDADRSTHRNPRRVGGVSDLRRQIALAEEDVPGPARSGATRPTWWSSRRCGTSRMSLELGDRVGLVGHNGAGKSTLLRLLSGIYEPTRGSAIIRGRVAPVFDLGVGMDPEISGYENIIIRGLFLGQTRKQMLAKVDEIADFTELGDYLSMPLRTYSTGMRVRLAMGVVTSIDPEILLLDEGIGAVDADFLKKAQTRLQKLVERSGILVFASHSNEFLARLCKTAMWIDHGVIKLTGGIEDVVRAYEGEDAARHVREVLAETDQRVTRRR